MIARSATGTLGGVSLKHISLVTVCGVPPMTDDGHSLTWCTAYIPEFRSHLGMTTTHGPDAMRQP